MAARHLPRACRNGPIRSLPVGRGSVVVISPGVSDAFPNVMLIEREAITAGERSFRRRPTFKYMGRRPVHCISGNARNRECQVG
jgi:hypothetical protein